MHLDLYRGFADELEKIAVMAVQKPKRKEEINPGASAGVTLGTAGAMLGARPAAGMLSENLSRTEAQHVAKYGPTTVDQLRQIKPHFKADPGTTVLHPTGNIGSAVHIPKGGAMPKWMGPQARTVETAQYTARGIPKSVVEKGYAGGVNVAPARAGLHVGAHEMGHASFRNTPMGRIMPKTYMPAMAAGTLGSLGMAGMADPDSRTSKMAPVVGAMGLAPRLTEEVIASHRGLQAMRKAGVSAAQMAAGRKQMAKAFGTYALATLPAAVGAPVLLRQYKKHQKRKRQLAQLQGG